MKVIDCFIFYNELNMLELRLEELHETVDLFVLVESTKTFAGKQKELLFNINRARFSKHLDKIIHVVVDDMPEDDNPWVLEHFQRNAIQRGIERIDLQDDDIIMITDLDEIPDSDTVSQFKNSGLTQPVSLDMDLYYYNFTCKMGRTWELPKAIPFGHYKTDLFPENWRHKSCHLVPRGGWHLSYFGTSDFICNKITSFSHQEYNNPAYNSKELIEDQMSKCEDPYRRDYVKISYVALEDNPYLPNNYKLFKTQDV